MNIERAQNILSERIEDLDELVAALGDLFPEELAMLNDPALDAEPTTEELAFMGPQFGERVSAHVLAKMDREQLLTPTGVFKEGIDLLKTLSSMDQAGYLARIAMADPESATELDKKRARLAIDMVELWEERKTNVVEESEEKVR